MIEPRDQMKKGDQLKKEDDRKDPSTAEIVMIVLSVAVVVLLFGYVTFHAITAPQGPDPVVVQKDVQRKGDTLQVTVLLVNKGGEGIRQATVAIPCDSPPPSITLDNIPADGRRTAILSCPANATTLQPEIESWAHL